MRIQQSNRLSDKLKQMNKELDSQSLAPLELGLKMIRTRSPPLSGRAGDCTRGDAVISAEEKTRQRCTKMRLILRLMGTLAAALLGVVALDKDFALLYEEASKGGEVVGALESNEQMNYKSLSERLRLQSEIDAMTKNGSWIRRSRTYKGLDVLASDSLGSPGRFASCRGFEGPMFSAKLGFSAADLGPGFMLELSVPHSEAATKRFAGHNELMDKDCTVSDWASNPLGKHGGSGLGAIHSWKTRDEAINTFRGRWVSFFGDSTTRIMFSAFVHLLNRTVEERTFPSHDFGYQQHRTIDNYDERSHCNIILYLDEADVLVTFQFVTRLSAWPDLVANFEEYHDKAEFLRANHRDSPLPDVVFLNSGPWEFYTYNGGADDKSSLRHSSNAERYRDTLDSFLRHNFGARIGTMPNTSAVVLGNTACPSDSQCEASGGTSCVEAMQFVDSIQRRVIEAGGDDMPLVRYLDSAPLFERLPPGYNCSTGGYHLPGLVTEARLSLALSAFV